MALEIFKLFRTGNIFSDTYVVRNSFEEKEMGIGEFYKKFNLNSRKINLSEDLFKDIKKYVEYLETKKEIWFSLSSVEDKKIESALLKRKLGVYEIE